MIAIGVVARKTCLYALLMARASQSANRNRLAFSCNLLAQTQPRGNQRQLFSISREALQRMTAGLEAEQR